MKDFLLRNLNFISGLFALLILVIFILVVLLISARELQVRTLERTDQPVVGAQPLLGPRSQISTRSKREVDVVLNKIPYVLGAWVLKNAYVKTEFPVIHVYSKGPLVAEAARAFRHIQEGKDGLSSDEFGASNPNALRNSEEARAGLIKCGPIKDTRIVEVLPAIAAEAKGACRAMLPPFTNGSNLVITAYTTVDGAQDSEEIREVRRGLLQLQLDLFNRDWQGRETWAHP